MSVAPWAARAVAFADVRRGLEGTRGLVWRSSYTAKGKGCLLGMNGFLFKGLLMSCCSQAPFR